MLSLVIDWEVSSMPLPQHELCTRKTELALEVKCYLDVHWVHMTTATNADQWKWRQIRSSAVWLGKVRPRANSVSGFGKFWWWSGERDWGEQPFLPQSTSSYSTPHYLWRRPLTNGSDVRYVVPRCSPWQTLPPALLQYIAFESNVPGEVYVSTRRAARNMAYQGFTPQDGVFSVLLELVGQVWVDTELSIYIHESHNEWTCDSTYSMSPSVFKHPFTPKLQKYIVRRCIGGVARIGSIIIFQLISYEKPSSSHCVM